MPCYEYFCPSCKTRFEVICNKDARDTIMCDKCSIKATRIVSSCSHTITGYCYTNEYKKKDDAKEFSK